MDNRQFFNIEAKKNRDEWLNADSNESGNAPQLPAAPFIIQIVNAAGQPAVSNVDIGDSYTNRTVSNFGQGQSISITSSVTGVSYREFLAQSESRPFVVGATMIISSTAGQLDYPYAITHRNASGDRKDFVLSPTIDPYQSQTDRIVDYTEYIFDGFSRIRLSQVGLNATVTVRIYPKDMFSATQVVAGRNEIENYSNPDIIKAIPFIPIR